MLQRRNGRQDVEGPDVVGYVTRGDDVRETSHRRDEEDFVQSPGCGVPGGEEVDGGPVGERDEDVEEPGGDVERWGWLRVSTALARERGGRTRLPLNGW